MKDLWRISNHLTLSGEGGLRYKARWHSAGSPIVYLAETPSGALLEVLVHLELDEGDLPNSYNLIRIGVPPEIEIAVLTIPAVPPSATWKTDETITREIGDSWLHSGKTALAAVPSVIMPSTTNYLLNPRHPKAASVQILEIIPATFDPRLLRRR